MSGVTTATASGDIASLQTDVEGLNSDQGEGENNVGETQSTGANIPGLGVSRILPAESTKASSSIKKSAILLRDASQLENDRDKYKTIVKSEAQWCIDNGKFEEAAQKIKELIEIYRKDQENSLPFTSTFISMLYSSSPSPDLGDDIMNLFIKLCMKDHIAADSIQEALSNSEFFTITVTVDSTKRSKTYEISRTNKGRKGIGESKTAESIPYKTNGEGRTLLSELHSCLTNKNITDVEGNLDRLAELCQSNAVSRDDFADFYYRFFMTNVTSANSHIKLFAEEYGIVLDGKYLTISDKKENTWEFQRASDIFFFLDKKTSLNSIKDAANDQDRFRWYIRLLGHYPEDREIIQAAEEASEKLEGTLMKIWTEFLVLAYCFYHNPTKFHGIAIRIKRELDAYANSKDSIEKALPFYITLLAYYRFMSSNEFEDLAADIEKKINESKEFKHKQFFLFQVHQHRFYVAFEKDKSKSIKEHLENAQQCLNEVTFPAHKKKGASHIIHMSRLAAHFTHHERLEIIPSQSISPEPQSDETPNEEE